MNFFIHFFPDIPKVEKIKILRYNKIKLQLDRQPTRGRLPNLLYIPLNRGFSACYSPLIFKISYIIFNNFETRRNLGKRIKDIYNPPLSPLLCMYINVLTAGGIYVIITSDKISHKALSIVRSPPSYPFLLGGDFLLLTFAWCK